MWCIILVGFQPALASADQSDSQQDFSTLDHEVQTLKKAVLAVNRELLLLEEEMLYPLAQRLVVLVSVESQPALRLDNIMIELDGEEIARHRYSDSENSALTQGGVHRPYIGTFEQGLYHLVVSLSGIGGNGAAFQRTAEQSITKGIGPKYIELRIERSAFSNKPGFSIYEW
jgi:hypothetical protein